MEARKPGLERDNHLSAIKKFLSDFSNSGYTENKIFTNYSLDTTTEELQYSSLKTQYYINGVQVFKEKKSINNYIDTFFENTFHNTDNDIIQYIKNHFHRFGFKHASQHTTQLHWLNHKRNCKITYFTDARRLDLIEKNDGSVTYIERFGVDSYYYPEKNIISPLKNNNSCFIGVTAYRISKERDGIKIEPYLDRTILIDLDQANVFFPETIKYHYNIEYANGKTLKEIEDKLNMDIDKEIVKSEMMPRTNKQNQAIEPGRFIKERHKFFLEMNLERHNDLVIFLQSNIEFFMAPFQDQERFAKWVRASSKREYPINTLSSSVSNETLIQFHEAIFGANGKSNGLKDGDEINISHLLKNNGSLCRVLRNFIDHNVINDWYATYHIKTEYEVSARRLG